MATYSGTGIWGYETIGKVFRNSGVYYAYADQTYFNTSTGNTYICTQGGYASVAKWKYDYTRVIRKPAMRVSSLCAPKRNNDGGWVFVSNWDVQAQFTDPKSCNRATSQKIERVIVGTNGNKNFELFSSATAAIETETASININSFSGTVGRTGSKRQNYSRSSFYPYTNMKVYQVGISVYARNSEGEGPAASVYRRISAPGQPTVAGPTVNTDTWRVSCVITPFQDTGSYVHYERAQTRYQVEVYDSSEAKPAWKTVQDGKTTTDNAITLSYDVQNAQAYGKYVMVRFRAMSLGLAGDSAWTTWRYHTVGWPAVATIKKVEMRSTSPTQYGTVSVESNSTSQKPVDRMVLQKLVSTDAITQEQAEAAQGWADTQYIDNASCKALAFLIGEVVPLEGKQSWLRIKTWHDKESVFAQYSKPIRLHQLFREVPPDPSAEDDTVVIASIQPGDDGASAVVQFAWDASGTDDADGTEVSWAATEKAWDSTTLPKTFKVPNDKSEGSLSYGGRTYNGSYTLIIDGLSQGVQVCVKCRRYMEANSTYGPYSNIGKTIPTIAPSGAVLMAPAFVAEGDGVPFAWAFDGGGIQQSWRLVTESGLVLASGTDAVGSCTVPAQDAEERSEDGVLTCHAEISTGGQYVESNTVNVTIAAPPEIGIGDIGTLTAQPATIPLTSSVGSAQTAIVVTAQGTEGSSPYGAERQLYGDTVWSAVLIPDWQYSVEDEVYEADVELPEGMDFRDLASYEVYVSAIDTVSGLSATAEYALFSVDWEHKAPAPSDEITLSPSVETDEDGNVARICGISLVAPDGAESSDVYDVYRITADGPQLIGSGLELDGTVTDRYAPFGEGMRYYRIACRTADGDVAWTDFDYILEGAVIRFDFDGDEHDWLELEYGTDVSEAYEKDFEAVRLMDGTTGGSWNAGVSHTARLDGSILRINGQEKVAALRDLARCTKPAFVRTGVGSAYAANVDVQDVAPDDFDGAFMNVSLTATEVDLVDAFALQGAEESEEPEDDEGGGE